MSATAVEQEPACPECGGRMWDNRLTKRNPKAPDFKCRDKGCTGTIWPPRGAAPKPRVQSSPTSLGKRGPFDPTPEEEELDRQMAGVVQPGGTTITEKTFLGSPEKVIEFDGTLFSLYEAGFRRLWSFHKFEADKTHFAAVADVAARLSITEYLRLRDARK